MKITKRVVFTQGGKGGVGKTTFANDLADWYRTNGVKVKLFDFDSENEAASGFQHFNPEAEKFNINEEGSLDAILSILDSDDCHVLLIDQAAASGEATFDWFEEVGETAREMGVGFTAVGMVTGDPGSVESVLKWIGRLGGNAEYLIVKNKMSNKREDFSAWTSNKLVDKFRKAYSLTEVEMDMRLPEFEEKIREAGATLASVSEIKSGPLSETRWRVRAQGYLKKSHALLDSVSELLTVDGAGK